MQLFSKMRYISAQFIPYLKESIWKENAEHANKMAAKLSSGFQKAGFKLAYRPESNGVFVYLDQKTISRLSKDFEFYVWDEDTSLCRLMCSFATKEKDVEALLKKL
ncbi:MAG: hypothetical protein C0602_02635 [Denitrovibrio sp.]|nr:MAG: hypothetical protein C0602_02635 [Denitrovibrio sp.]